MDPSTTPWPAPSSADAPPADLAPVEDAVPFAIASFVISFTVPFAGPVAAALGHVALSRMGRSGNQSCHGLALAGTILGYVQCALLALGFVALLVLWANFE